MQNLTQVLQRLQDGDRAAADELLPLVYDALRQQAARQLAQEKPGQTLQPTALVHEAYLRLLGPANAAGFAHRKHFYAAAAEAMRRILIERARRRQTEKHGGLERQFPALEALPASERLHPTDLLALDEALTKLHELAPKKAELVRLRYFAGCSLPEAAELLEISLATAERHWAYAKAWLYQQLSTGD